MIHPTILHEVRSIFTMRALRCYEDGRRTFPLEVAEDLSFLRILVYSECIQFIYTYVL
jgi:hypothetical protein